MHARTHAQPVQRADLRKGVERLERDEFLKFTSGKGLGNPTLRVLV